MELPLEGIRVVELATVVAAPTAGRLLADYGAEVIKVEIPGTGDLLRNMGDMHQLPVEDDNNPLFAAFNAGKKMLALDLKNGGDKKRLLKILGTADVFLTNTRMRSLEKMGLGYEALKEQFPRLIYAHLSGFGLDGPDRDRPGYDSTAFWMRSGALTDMGLPGAFPSRPPYAFGDIATASYLLNGILMALIGREKNGKGTLVSTALFGAGIWMCTPYVINTQPRYGKQLPSDRYDPWNPFSDIYRCKDGLYISPIAKRYPQDRPMLAELFGMPELTEDPDLETISSMRRSGKLAQVTKRMEEAMLTRNSWEWAELFEKYDLPYEIERHIADVPSDEQAWANGFLSRVELPDGETVFPNPPIRFSEYGRKAFVHPGPVNGDAEEKAEKQL